MPFFCGSTRYHTPVVSATDAPHASRHPTCRSDNRSLVARAHGGKRWGGNSRPVLPNYVVEHFHKETRNLGSTALKRIQGKYCVFKSKTCKHGIFVFSFWLNGGLKKHHAKAASDPNDTINGANINRTLGMFDEVCDIIVISS